MKFEIGNIVKEIRGFEQEGIVIDAELDRTAASGEWYNIRFGDGGVEGSDGSGFKKLESKYGTN